MSSASSCKACARRADGGKCDLHTQLLEQEDATEDDPEHDAKKVLVECSIKKLREAAAKKGKLLYHQEQEKTADSVVNCILFTASVVFQLVRAMIQTGKTGCMLAVIEKCFLLEKKTGNRIDPSNIYITTGLSSNDWKQQTEKRMPEYFKTNIYHRGELKQLGKKLAGKRDALIMIDEVHVASKENMTMDKVLKELGFKNHELLLANNIRIVLFSATPAGIMKDLRKWGDEYAAEHTMNPGTGYTGIKELLETGRVCQAKELYIDSDPTAEMNESDRQARRQMLQPAYDAIEEMKATIDSYNEPKYHIIRTPAGEKGATVRARMREKFDSSKYEHIECDSASEEQVLVLIKQKKLSHSPHTLLYIKETMRCTVTLEPKSHIGIMYERICHNIQDDTIVQGVRLSGYDVDRENIMFTNIESLERYVGQWESGMTEDYSLKKTGGKTFVNPAGYTNTGLAVVEDETKQPRMEMGHREFDDFEDIKAAASIMGYKKHSVKPSKLDEGFFKTSLNAKKSVHSLVQVLRKIKGAYGGGGGTIKFRTYYPCYEDIADPSTLRFVFIIRPKDDGSDYTAEQMAQLDALSKL